MRVVVTLCGIPGSGKTFFAELLECNLNELNLSTSSVHFDQHLPSRDKWDGFSFSRARTAALDAVKSLLALQGDLANNVVIVDDNMYLHSMRREVYVIARDMGVRMLLVWIKTAPQLAQERNMARTAETAVDADSFNNMVQRFEPPDSERIEDRNCVILENAREYKVESGVVEVLTRIQSMMKEGPLVVPLCSQSISSEELNNSLGNKISEVNDTLKHIASRIMKNASRQLSIAIDSTQRQRARSLLCWLSTTLATVKAERFQEMRRQLLDHSDIVVDANVLERSIREEIFVRWESHRLEYGEEDNDGDCYSFVSEVREIILSR